MVTYSESTVADRIAARLASRLPGMSAASASDQMTYQGQISVATNQYAASRTATDHRIRLCGSRTRQAATSQIAPKISQVAPRMIWLANVPIGPAAGLTSSLASVGSLLALTGRSVGPTISAGT